MGQSVGSRTTGGWRSRLPALGMTQRGMKSWWRDAAAGQSVTPAPRSAVRHSPASRVSVPTLSRTRSRPRGRGAARTPLPRRERCQSRAGRAGTHGVTWPGRCGPLPAPTAFPRPTLFPVPCQNPNRIIRPAVCPALPKHKPFPSPTRINSPNPDFYKQPAYFFGRSTVPAGSGQV